MPTYFVRFKSRCRIRLGTYAQIQGPEVVRAKFKGDKDIEPIFVLYGLTEQIGNIKVPSGIGLDAHIEASSIVEAIQAVQHMADYVIDVLTLASLSEPHMATFVLAYDASPGITTRELIASNPIGPAIVSRALPEWVLKNVLGALNAARKASPGSNEAQDRMNRVDRAIKWLRKGIGETAILDEFTAYWIGLEVMDPVIRPVQRIFKSCPECGKSIDHCPHCRAEVPKSEKVNPFEGIRHVLEEQCGLSKEVFKEVRNMRGAVLHGGKGLGKDELELITKHMAIFRRGLVRSICLALALDDAIVAGLSVAEPRRMHCDVTQRLRTTISLPHIPSLDEISRQPAVEIDASRTAVLCADKDDINESYSCNPKAINCEFSSGFYIEFLTDPFSGLKLSPGK